MRIGEAAAASRTTPRALRFYERRGLLPPLRRSASGQPEYGPQSAPHAFASHSTARSSPSPWSRVTFSRAVTCQRAVSCDSIATRHPQLLGISSGEARLVPHHGAWAGA